MYLHKINLNYIRCYDFFVNKPSKPRDTYGKDYIENGHMQSYIAVCP